MSPKVAEMYVHLLGGLALSACLSLLFPEMEPVARPSIPSMEAMSRDTPFSKSVEKSTLLNISVRMASEAKWFRS